MKKLAPGAAMTTRDETSMAMPTSFMTGSVVGKRFYRDATVRRADDGNGWTMMLDYRTLKSPAKRPHKLPSPTLAMAIAAEWEYQCEMTGVVVDVGDGATHIVPVADGYVIGSSIRSIPITGKDVLPSLFINF